MKFDQYKKIVYLIPNDRLLIIELLQLFHYVNNQYSLLKQQVIIDVENSYLFKCLPFEIDIIENPNLSSFKDVHRYCANNNDLFNVDIFYDFIGDNLSSFWGMTLRAKINWGSNNKFGRLFYKGKLEDNDPFKLIKTVSEKYTNDLLKNHQSDYTLIYLSEIQEETIVLLKDIISLVVGKISLVIVNDLDQTHIENNENDKSISNINLRFIELISEFKNIIYFTEGDEYLPALISKARLVFTNSSFVSSLAIYLNRKSVYINSELGNSYLDEKSVFIKTNLSSAEYILYKEEKVLTENNEAFLTQLEKEFI